MSNRDEMLLESKFKNGVPKVIKDGKLLEFKNGDRIIWNDLKGLMIITPPDGEDFQFCSIRVQSKINVIIECSIEEGNWKIRFPRSKSKLADSPTTVNVTVAPPEGNGP